MQPTFVEFLLEGYGHYVYVGDKSVPAELPLTTTIDDKGNYHYKRPEATIKPGDRGQLYRPEGNARKVFTRSGTMWQAPEYVFVRDEDRAEAPISALGGMSSLKYVESTGE